VVRWRIPGASGESKLDVKLHVYPSANKNNPVAVDLVLVSDKNSRIFTVQVGVFLDQNEASRFLREMGRKGYAPTFFADRDSENRQWYAVRIGAYPDEDQAANAAANLTRQEKIKAVVRPLGSL
jgi:septal ring-binding cell division protein DamX